MPVKRQALGDPTVPEPEDIERLSALVADGKSRTHAMLERVAELVRAEEPEAAQEIAARWIEQLNGRLFRQSGVLEGRFGTASDARKPLILLGHLDTVWSRGTLQRMPVRVEEGWAYGPGILDMKAGVVMALEAVRLAAEVDPGRPILMLLSGDEETGSHRSRHVIEETARGAAAVFVLEPAQGPQGAYKTARKGVGQFRLEVRGVASHSGVDFEAGHSAIRELAWQIERIAELTDLSRGTTLNPGVIGGGTQSNVVAAEAWAEIDLRVTSKAEAEAVQQRLKSLTPRDPRCTLTLSGGLNRPPMERTAATAELFLKAQAIAGRLGFHLEEAATGGGSDGNFTSALGVPTLDGMGAVGKGAHAENESIVVDSLVYRTALLAGMLLSC